MRAGALLLLLLLAAPVCGGRRPSPSVVLVTIDTLRADAVGAYGASSARTPRLDRLAAEGVRFDNAVTLVPLTLPSHATILTGLRPPEHGFRDNDPPRPLPPARLRSFRTLAEIFAERGYSTAAFVSASVLSSRTGIDQGFDVYDEPPPARPGALEYEERPGGETVDRARSWLAGAHPPFFLWVHLFDPHAPYRPPVAFRSGAAPDSPDAYADEVAYADHCLGRLLDALTDRNVVVAVTADHGEGLGEHGEPTHGYLLFETTLHVPLILRRPGLFPAATTRTDSVSLADLFPTILEAAGVPVPPGLPGRSLVRPGGARTLCGETLYGWRHMSWAQLFFARRGDLKLVRGRTARAFDLREDPEEKAPVPVETEGLAAAIDAYRALGPRSGRAERTLPPVQGLPYLSGLGRRRLAVVSFEENARHREPDPAEAREIDRWKSRVGRDRAEVVDGALRALARKDPENPTIRFWIGRNAGRAGRHAEAAEAYSKAFSLGLAEAKVMNLWMKHLALDGRIREAVRTFGEHRNDFLPDAATFLMLADCERALGRMDLARRHADHAARIATTIREREQVSQFRHNLK